MAEQKGQPNAGLLERRFRFAENDTTIAVASPLVVYEPVEVFSAAVVEREP